MGGLIVENKDNRNACSDGWYYKDLSCRDYSFNQYLNITLLDENVEKSVMTIMHSRTYHSSEFCYFTNEFLEKLLTFRISLKLEL
jgi:hypothetical protein